MHPDATPPDDITQIGPDPTAPPPPERRRPIRNAAIAVNVYTWLAFVLAGLSIVAVILILVLAPAQAIVAIPAVIGILMPLMQALTSAGLRGVAVVADGQTGVLVHAVKEAERSKGILAAQGITPPPADDDPSH